jgi:acetolactate synthase-1/2/3 large subunit
LIYLSEFAINQLKDVATLVLLGANEPVGFFAYPNVPSRLVSNECEIVVGARPGTDTVGVLRSLVESLRAPALDLPVGEVAPAPSGELTTATFAQAVAATLPEDIIMVDESNTSGVHVFGATKFSPPYELLTLTGGSIGFGLPSAVGAAVAGGGRRVLSLEADGSMLYTAQALWTMARESLDVTVVALNNRSYAVLNLELSRVGATAEGAASRRMLELDDPAIDLCRISEGYGVPATRVTTADELVTSLQRSYATPGPSFIEVMLPKGLN